MDVMVFVGPLERANEVRGMPGVTSVRGAWALPGVGDGLVVYLSGTEAEVEAAYNRLGTTHGLKFSGAYPLIQGV